MTASHDKPAALPDYPPVWRSGNRNSWLICTRKQAEAGKVIAKSVKIPHEGTVR